MPSGLWHICLKGHLNFYYCRFDFSVAVYENRFKPLKLTLTELPEKTYMKLIVCKKTNQLLGCHIVGEGAAEILQGFAVAVRNKL